MVIEITTKKIAVFFTIVILICGGFACGFYLGKEELFLKKNTQLLDNTLSIRQKC